MLQLHKQIASVLGIGYIKGGGTFASIVYCIVWFLLPAGFRDTFWQAAVTLLIILTGTWSADKVEASWGKDSSRVVMDEVAGMAITLLYAPHTLWCVITGLVFFRLFDILKPFGIRSMEKLKGGVGVMADDILSGIYAFIVLRIAIVCLANYFT